MHWGGGNSRLASHIKGFNLIGLFNNLAPWGENKFVSELKRTYKFQRGVNNILDCHANQTRILSKEYSFVAGDYVRSTARNDVKRHTEDNSPKYRMVGEILSILRSFAVQTRIFAKECNIIAVGYVRSTAQDDENLNRLRNKCAMTWNSDMEENNFTDKVFSRFTSHFSLKSAAFTLAEVLVTLGIIGVVSAMTVPTLMQNYQRQSYVTQLHKVYNEMSQVFQQMMTDRNALNLKETGLLNTTEQATETFKNYLKVVQDCGNNFSPCFASEYRSTTGSSIKTVEANWWSSSFVLADGAAIGLHGLIDYSAGNVSYPYGYMYVDINGAKGPNIAGRDFFLFYYFNDGTLDDVVTPECKTARICSSTLEVQRVNSTCVGQTWPAGCFGRILNDNWQMTY